MISSRQTVRWRDFDPLGHVNSVVFLTYLEEGRNAWLREVLGTEFSPEQYVIARFEIDYRREIPGGTEYVETEHELVATGRSSVTFSERLLIDHIEVAANARVVIVMWEPNHRRSRIVSTQEREALASTANSE
jgi:acyl-CoA thioester hydrolase